MTRITVMLLTAHRLAYAEQTLRSTLQNIKVSTDHQLQVHIASDGDENDYVWRLCDIARDFVLSVTSSNSGGNGYGANYNLATQIVHPISDVVLPLEDDWELTRELVLNPLLLALNTFNCIRLGYIGYTQPLRANFEYVDNHNYLRLDPYSEEPHVFAGHPRLERVSFQREVGEWPLAVDPGTTEFIVAHRPEARQGVAWPVDLVKPYGDLFAHIGTERSY